MQRSILSVVLVLFSILSVVALQESGYIGLFTYQFQTWSGVQVISDLFISVGLLMVWMWRDAKANGRRAELWIVFTLITGSFGPLLYLLTARRNTTNAQAAGKSTFVV